MEKSEHIEKVKIRARNMWFCPDCARWITDEDIKIRDAKIIQHRKTHE